MKAGKRGQEIESEWCLSRIGGETTDLDLRAWRKLCVVQIRTVYFLKYIAGVRVTKGYLGGSKYLKPETRHEISKSRAVTSGREAETFAGKDDGLPGLCSLSAGDSATQAGRFPCLFVRPN